MSELTEAAKAEIAAAIAIVREDRFEKHVRATLGKHSVPQNDPTPPSPNDPSKEPEKDPTVPPPPAKDPEPDPEPTGRKSAYWGEIFD